MKVMRKHVDSGELRIGDFEPLWIFLFVEFSTYGQARLGSGSGNELDDCAKAAQGFAAPVDADERKKPMLVCELPTRPGLCSKSIQNWRSRIFPTSTPKPERSHDERK